MNREQKRAMERKLRKKGYTEADAKQYVKSAEALGSIIRLGSGEASPPQKFNEGDKVKLNLSRIKGRKNYDKMLDNYKEFVDGNADTVFTAHVERKNLISMQEEPRWLFWSGDLDLVERAEAEEE